MNTPKTPGLAIASLICGILGFFTCLLTGIPAIITGHLSLRKIKMDPASFKGDGMALTGLILGYITTVASILLIPLAAMATPAIFKALERAKMAENMSNARLLYVELSTYAYDHGGDFPPDLATLETSGTNLDDFRFVDKDKKLRDWIYHPGLTDTSDPTFILLAAPANSMDGAHPQMIIVHVDGSTILIPTADYPALLTTQSP